FVDGRRGCAVAGRGALLQTADGGEHWELRRPPAEDALEDVFFTDQRTGWVVCVRSAYAPMKKDEPRSYLLKTADGGETWARVDVTGAGEDLLQLARVRFADAERGWVFGEEGALYATADGGQTWTRLRVPTRHLLLGASLLDARQGWLVGAGSTLLQTTDGGVTWREGSASPSSSIRLNAVSFADARHGWAVGARGAVLATSDGGRTGGAQALGTESDLSDVKFF